MSNVLQFPRQTTQFLSANEDTLVRKHIGSGGPTGFPLRATEVGPSPSVVRTSGLYNRASVAHRVIGVIEIDSLYPAAEEPKPDLLKALRLLSEAIGYLDQAVGECNSSPIAADRQVQHMQVLLPQLFAYRKVGEGFALLINSIQFAMVNKRGKILTREELITIWRVLKELRTRPVLSFEQGLEYVGELEGSGLEVDPPILSELVFGVDE